MENVKNDTSHTGRLFMIDGPDGVGKTTQIQLLKNALVSNGYTAYSSRLSGGTTIGEALREVSLNPSYKRSATTDLYIMLAMYSALADDIKSKREAGAVCLIDRSPLSIMAYQVYGSGLPINIGKKAITDALALFKPDLIICYDAPLSALHIQRQKRNQVLDYFESKPPEFMERVCSGYREASATFGATVIAANFPEQTVHAHTLQVVEKLLMS